MDELGLVTGSKASACLTALDDPKMIWKGLEVTDLFNVVLKIHFFLGVNPCLNVFPQSWTQFVLDPSSFSSILSVYLEVLIFVSAWIKFTNLLIIYTPFFAWIHPTLYIIHFLQLISMKYSKYGYRTSTSKLDFIYCTKIQNLSTYHRIADFLSLILYFQIQNAAFLVNYVVSISCCLLSNILYIIGSFQFVLITN